MKTYFTCLIFLFFGILKSQPIVGDWKFSAPYKGGSRDDGSAFSVNGFGYYGCGANGSSKLTNDWWRYDPETNVWTELDTLPGTKRQYSSVLQVGERIYLVGGSTNFGVSNEVFQFDVSKEKWKKIANAPFYGVAAAASFSYQDKAYILGGRNDSAKVSDFWEFNTTTNTWRKMPTPPFGARDEMSAFCLGKRAIVLLGRNNDKSETRKVYAFDLVYGVWRENGTYPGKATSYCECRPIGGKYAVCAGGQAGNNNLLGEAYYFDDSLNTFFELPELLTPEIRGMQSFTIDNRIYFLCGITPHYTRVNTVQRLSFDDIQLGRQMRVNVYPNPAVDWVIVSSLDEPNMRIDKAYINNFQNTTKLEDCILTDGTAHFDVRNLPVGAYWIVLELSNKQFQRVKLIVTH